MTPEERLRELLQDAAEQVVPAYDALPLLRARIRENRSWRHRLQPLVATAAGLAVVVAGTLATSASDRSTADRAVERLPGPVPTVQPSACEAQGDVLCAEPAPLPPVPTTSNVTTSSPGTPYWPFSDDREAAAWVRDPGARTWAADPSAVAQHLVDDLLGLRDVTAGPVQGTEVPLRAAGRLVGTVSLVQVGVGAGLPWSVTSVVGTSVQVDGPDEGQGVGSPLTATGSASGPVLLRLLDDAGTELSRGTAASGAEGWEASLDWDDLRWSTGALVAMTAGSPSTGLALTPVRRSGSPRPGLPPPGSTFVAVDGTAVVLHDARTGERLRELSYPGDAVDSSPSRGGDGVVFVRRRPDRCADVLLRVSLGKGATGLTAADVGRRREHPALSPDSRMLAWVERPCNSPGGDLVIRGADGRERRVPLVSERVDLSGVRDLGLRDDGTLLIEKADGGVTVLADGATSVDTAVPLGAGSGDCSDAAPAWSGDDVYLWRGCEGRRVGLLLEAPGYDNGLRAPTAAVAAVRTTSVAQTTTGPQVLVQLGRADAPGPLARVVDGRLVELYANQACDTGGPGCLTDPAW